MPLPESLQQMLLARQSEQIVWILLAVVGLCVGSISLLALALAGIAILLMLDARRTRREALAPTQPAGRALLSPPLELQARLSGAREKEHKIATTPPPPTSPPSAPPSARGSTPARLPSLGTPPLPPAREPSDCAADALAVDMSELGRVCRGLEQAALSRSAQSRSKSARIHRLEERLSEISIAYHTLKSASPCDASDGAPRGPAPPVSSRPGVGGCFTSDGVRRRMPFAERALQIDDDAAERPSAFACGASAVKNGVCQSAKLDLDAC
jgi:hypothetical protein